jgi:predicted glycosyl hydrolase (DUF1957 family)
MGSSPMRISPAMTLDELCGPGLSYGIFIPGCTFGDSIEADDADAEVVIFLVDDFDFNDDFTTTTTSTSTTTAAAVTLSGSKSRAPDSLKCSKLQRVNYTQEGRGLAL